MAVSNLSRFSRVGICSFTVAKTSKVRPSFSWSSKVTCFRITPAFFSRSMRRQQGEDESPTRSAISAMDRPALSCTSSRILASMASSSSDKVSSLAANGGQFVPRLSYGALKIKAKAIGGGKEFSYGAIRPASPPPGR
jgi:hypothetical protein